MEIEPEKVAMFQMRGHAPWYMKGLKSSARVKNELSLRLILLKNLKLF